jgi:limonene-1,2-epoxide hydrolase
VASTTSIAAKKPANPDRPSRPPFLRRWMIGLIVLVGAILLFAVLAYIRISPFSERSVLQNLTEASDSVVTIRSFRRTHFPSPGCVLEGIEFHKGQNRFTIIAIDKLVIKGTYLGILRHHIDHIKAVGAHIFIPPFGSDLTFNTEHSNIVVDEIIANGTQVEVAAEEQGKKPLLFDVHDALLTDVRWASPIHYQLKFHNPNPPGEIDVKGDFGAWTTGHPGDTPLSGEFSFDKADLSVYGGIAGLLSSEGKFDGPLKHIHITGTTDTPDFEVQSGGHKVDLKSQFDAFVDAIHGDTFLNRVDAKFGRTTVITEGSIAGTQGQKGKSALLHLTTRRGRIEDVLGLFVSTPRSPMSGELYLTSKAEISPGDEDFLRKVKMNGSFGVDAGKFTQSETQKDVDALSAGARGGNKEDPETVVTDLTGQVALVGGVAQFSDLSFGVPGANARLHGTYDILNHRIDLHGHMRVDTKISKTSTGFKSFLLKVMDPLFKKKKKGEIVPVHILGTYEKPQFGLDLTQPADQSKDSSKKK